MSSEPPLRQNWQDSVATPIEGEIEEQQAKRKKRRSEENRQKRPKATYDLPLSLIEAIKQISKTESVPRSDLAVLALVRFIESYKAGEIKLEPLKIPNDSLMFEWKLDLPDDS
jgi:hypothetical protein